MLIAVPDKTVFNSSRCLSENYLKRHFKDFYEYIMTKEIEGSKNPSISERLYNYYQRYQRPVCPVCQKYTKFLSFGRGYNIYCSPQCCGSDPKRQKKTEQTKSIRYGDPHYTNIEKIKQTKLDRYGDSGYFDKEKMKETCLERYGVENISQNQEILEKIKFTKKDIQEKINQKIKQTWSLKSKEEKEQIIKKIKTTKQNKYDDENYNNLPKATKTNLIRFGVDNPMKLQEIRDKSRQTCLERYGVTHPMRCESIKIDNIKSRNKYYIEENNLIDIVGGEWTCKCPHETCTKCEEKCYNINSSQFYARKQRGIEPCTKLLPINSNSGTSIEAFIRDILDEYKIEYQTNVRNIISPQELDIYIPSKQLAIECNGVYWHSKYDVNYHLDKYLACKNKNIQLISIWEDWIHIKPQLVKSLVLSKLGIYTERIYARKCAVKDISSKECSEFLDKNHIQGRTKTCIRKGLYYNDCLISVMTFSKKSKLSGSKQNSEEWVLSRFCTLLNTQCVGGANKLLSHFIKENHPVEIVSFASNDISNGNLYKQLGFEQRDITKSYWYIHKNDFKRYHRSSFSKKQLNKMGYDIENKTENDIMKELPFYKIYDSGHTKYSVKFDIFK